LIVFISKDDSEKRSIKDALKDVSGILLRYPFYMIPRKSLSGKKQLRRYAEEELTKMLLKKQLRRYAEEELTKMLLKNN